MSNRDELIKEINIAKKRNEAPGVIFALADHGSMKYKETLGYRDLETQKEINEDTVFGIASITKSFTCVALMHLQEQGKLTVNDLVIKHLPEFRVGEDQSVANIKVHHFMTHSSGLPPMDALDYSFKRATKADPYALNHVGADQSIDLIDTGEQLMDYIAQKEVTLLGEPGAQFSYSNEAYSLLGTIIERVSGMSYKDYVMKYVIGPCGLKNTKFQIEDYDNYDNITKPYKAVEVAGETVIEADENWADSNSMRATGLLKSTAKDLLIYAEIFRNKGNVNGVQVISEQSVEQMVKPHIYVHYGEYYGYGLRINPDYFGDTMVGHGGSLRSVSSRFGVIMEKGVSGVVLANKIGFAAARSLDKLFNDYFSRDINAFTPYKAHEVSQELLLSYVGKYESNEGANLELLTKEGRLVFKNKGELYNIKFISEAVFVVEYEDSRSVVEMLFDDEDKPNGLSYGSRFVHKVT